MLACQYCDLLRYMINQLDLSMWKSSLTPPLINYIDILTKYSTDRWSASNSSTAPRFDLTHFQFVVYIEF